MYKAAIIGCGNIAGNYQSDINDDVVITHVSAYRKCKDTDVVAIADPNKKILNEFGERWSIDKRYSDYQDMIEEQKLDIVSICAPTTLNYEILENVSKTSVKAIYMEKPVAINSADSKNIANLNSEKIIAVNYFRRWNKDVQNLVAEIKNGVYGEVRRVNIMYQKGVFNNASHAIDILNWCFGCPEKVENIGCNMRTLNNDPNLDFTLCYKNGMRATFINIEENSYHLFELDFFTSTTRLKLQQRGQQISYFKNSIEPFYKSFNILNEEDVLDTDWKQCMANAVIELTECIRSNNQTSCTLVDGLEASKVCLSVIEQWRKQNNE